LRGENTEKDRERERGRKEGEKREKRGRKEGEKREVAE